MNGVKMMTLVIPEEVHKRFKIWCVLQKKGVQDAAVEMLVGEIEKLPSIEEMLKSEHLPINT
jgi:hypothetical protein